MSADVLGYPEAIWWRDAEQDPPPAHTRILATMRDHPEQPAGECFTYGRPFGYAYFPGLNNNYRIALWAELPTGRR